MDDLVFLIKMLVSVFLIFSSIGVVIATVDSTSCNSYGDRTNQKVDWSFTNGCMVQIDGVWKPSKNTVEIVQ